MVSEQKPIVSNNCKQNNYWYKFNESSQVTVIFVHGFLSNSSDCWKSAKGPYWPDLIISDERFEAPSIFLSGYHTDIDSESYQISDCAAEVFSAIQNVSEDGRPAPIKAKNILFVCHSLGGIVTRYMLESKQIEFSGKTIGLVLMASPSLGSAYADFFSFLGEIFRNRLASQLKVMNPALEDLDNRFRNLLDKNPMRALVGVEGIEQKGLLACKWLPPFLNPIVGKFSASRYFPNSRTLPNTNHETIVKPDSNTHTSHEFLVGFYTNKFKEVVQITSEIVPAEIGNICTEDDPRIREIAELVLFDILGRENIPYFLERDFDRKLDKALQFRSVWVTGKSGTGKTSSIRYYLTKNNYRPLEIYLSHYGSNLTKDGFISEIVATANQLELGGKSYHKSDFQTLITLLSEYSNASSVVLHLDEISVSETNLEPSKEILDLLSDLLNAVKQRTGSSNLRFVISSINTPELSTTKSQGKIKEQLEIIEIPTWTSSEIGKLLEVIINSIPELSLSKEQQMDLIASCNESPRELKNLVRDILRK